MTLIAVDAVEPGTKSLWGPILGYGKSSSQHALTWRTVPSFLPSQMQDPEHTNVEQNGEQGWCECPAPQGKHTEAGLISGPKAGL